MAEPPFLMRLAAHVAEVPESEDISGGQGRQVCFRSSGPPGVFSEFRGIRKENVLWCPGNFAEWGISRKITCRYPKRQ